MPRQWPSRAKRWPITPVPTTPSVLPLSSPPLERPPVAAVGASEVLIGRRHLAHHGEHQPQGEFGDGVGRIRGYVADHDVSLTRRRETDIVETCRPEGDELQARQGVDDLTADLRPAGDDDFGISRPLDDLIVSGRHTRANVYFALLLEAANVLCADPDIVQQNDPHLDSYTSWATTSPRTCANTPRCGGSEAPLLTWAAVRAEHETHPAEVGGGQRGHHLHRGTGHRSHRHARACGMPCQRGEHGR